MGFELESPKKIYGVSNLEYIVSGLAYNERLNHYLLINCISMIAFDFKKELLLQVLDIGEKFNLAGKNISIVTYKPSPTIYDKNFDLDCKKELKFEEGMKKIKNDKNYNDWLDISSKLLYDSSKSHFYNPQIITNIGQYEFNMNESGSFLSLGENNIEKFIAKKNETDNFIRNYGGFSIDISSFDKKDLASFLDTKKKSNKLSFIKNYKIHSYLYPSIDKFIFGLTQKKGYLEDSVINEYLEKTLVLGHQFSSSEIFNETRVKDVLEIVKSIKPSRINGKVSLSESKQTEIIINFEKERMIDSVLNRVVKITESVAKRFSLNAKVDLEFKPKDIDDILSKD